MRLKTVLALFAGLCLPVSAVADTFTFSYTGNSFTSFGSNGAGTPYTASDFVSGQVTLNLTSADNLAGAVSPASFSFSDGVQTLTNNSTGLASQNFNITTDGNGNVTSWNIFIGTSGNGNYIRTTNGQDDVQNGQYVEVPEYGYVSVPYYGYVQTGENCDFFGCSPIYTYEFLGYGEQYEFLGYQEEFEYSYASNNGGGNWTVTDDTTGTLISPQTAGVTPEPSSLLLLGTGMAGAACFARKRIARRVSAPHHSASVASSANVP